MFSNSLIKERISTVQSEENEDMEKAENIVSFKRNIQFHQLLYASVIKLDLSLL